MATEGIPTRDDLDLQQRQVDITNAQTDATEKSAAQFKLHADQISQNQKEARGFGKALGENNDLVSKLISMIPGLGNMGEFLSKNTEMLTKFGLTGSHVFLTFSGVLQKNEGLFGELGKTGTAAGLSISNSFAQISPVMAGLGFGKMADGFGKVIGVADQLQSLQFGLYGAAAASGQLNTFLSQTGSDLAGLEDATARYNERLFQEAIANHTTIDVMASYTQGMKEIPGALNEVIKVNERFGGQMSVSSAAVKVANAWGLKHEDVTKLMVDAYRNLGTSATDSLKILDRIGTTTQAIKLPMDIVRTATMNAAESFKFFGDNTQAALNILTAFSPALKESGLGPEAIKSVVLGMTNGIAKMDIAKKAFISGASGGMGGLAGAFQVDELIATKQVDKVMAMTMSAMERQFGGPVLERKDVTENPALAGEFLKQMEFIKSVGGLAGSDAEAQQVLAAMKHGAVGDLEKLISAPKTPEDALKASMEIGNNVQMKIESNIGKLLEVSRGTQRILQGAAISNQEIVKRVAGNTGTDLSEAARKAAVAAKATVDGGKALGGFERPSTTARLVTAGTVHADTTNQVKGVVDAVGSLKSNLETSKEFGDFKREVTTMLKGKSLPELTKIGKSLGLEGEELGKENILKSIGNLLGPMLGGANLEARTPVPTTPGSAMQPHVAPPQKEKAQMLPTEAATGAEQVVHVIIDIKDGIETIVRKVITSIPGRAHGLTH